MKFIQNIRQSIRLIKNDSVQNYYKARINKVKNPYRVWLKAQPYKILLVLSHMRSGSSLLTHLVISNPEIIGYGETHLQYALAADFKKLIFKVYWRGNEFKQLQDLRNLSMHHKYVLDKLLHDNKLLDEQILQSENIYSIFLIRESQRSLPSILDIKPHWHEKEAVEYYKGRLATLERYAKIINDKERSLLITHQQVIDRSSDVFLALKNFLGVKEGFSENYKVLSTTGTRHVGDSKGNIKAGQIIREPRSLDIHISPDSINEGKQYFLQCHSILSQYCSII